MPETDHKAIATREAATIIAELGVTLPIDSLELLTTLVGAAYLKGVIAGSAETLRHASAAIDSFAAKLAGRL